MLTKKQPSRFSKKVEPVVCEASDQAFVAIGTQVNVFSLKTGLQIGVLRQHGSNKNGALEDVHKANVIAMQLYSPAASIASQRLITLCARGFVAEWSTSTFELLKVSQLELPVESFSDGGKIKHASIGKRYIVVFQQDIRTFRVFDLVSRQLKTTMQQQEAKGFVSHMRTLQADLQETS